MSTIFFSILYIGALVIGWRSHAAYLRSARYDLNRRGTHPVKRILRKL